MTRRINLLPPEIAVRRRVRQQRSGAMVAAAILVVMLGLFYLVQHGRLAGERAKLEEQKAENTTLQGRVALLEEFDRLAREVEAKTKLVDDLTKAEVRWSVVLADVSLVIPSDTWLTNLAGTVNEAAGNTRPAANQRTELGKVDMSGVTFAHVDVARWLVRLAGVDGFTFPYLSLSAKGEIGTTPVVNFTTSVELSESAFRRNQRGAQRPR